MTVEPSQRVAAKPRWCPIAVSSLPNNKLPSKTWRSILLWAQKRNCIRQCECVHHQRVSPSSLPNHFFPDFELGFLSISIQSRPTDTVSNPNRIESTTQPLRNHYSIFQIPILSPPLNSSLHSIRQFPSCFSRPFRRKD
ncbi:unnamed protein product [Lactuca virosa]|uniref:Uncharacterized protein n=1 Tax=Lactuca virosa TaxID=75947 RepID=A0AAU9MJ20_9ASTR|nr:unnamed protein product [Lactuca virosa]